ncbi:S-methyl-5-thioribose kinase [uncultured Faecalicoccus sp.]|uniref:S-methyl-5-thioribose kinase n=1 Tax=uncultured Faecalicoccus sp. TaxID=1971760 RepID=UPI0025841DD8|nr:S-methyl-5-thioribose kinase [uncultured Faecalicoccus sp.]
MDKYAEHFLLDTEEAKQYVVNRIHYFENSDNLEAFEIGDGNINYVFKVINQKTGRSIVLKQADKFLRSSGRPLDVYRNKIEAEILQWEGELAKGYVPEVYNYDETMCVLAMEDISDYKNMRKELMQGKTFPHFPQWISDFLASTLLPTTDLVFDRHEKKKKVRLFTNIALCDITEDLVLTEPYEDYKHRNIIYPGNEKFVEEFLYKDTALRAEVAKLRNTFMNNAQALLHGDLHSGSIFINNKGLKVIDPEFAFYGPMGYDIGNVIGNMFFSWAYVYYGKKTSDYFLNWIEDSIAQTFDVTMKKLEEKYDQIVSFSLYRENGFKTSYLKSVQADTLGYAGTEIIRRVVGDSKVIEVTSMEDKALRVNLERALIKMGIYLIKNRNEICSGNEITEQFR